MEFVVPEDFPANPQLEDIYGKYRLSENNPLTTSSIKTISAAKTFSADPQNIDGNVLKAAVSQVRQE